MNGLPSWRASIAILRERSPATEVAPISAAELHERYLADVFRYVSRRVGQRAEAEDITAEVFVAAFAMLPRFRNQCTPQLWLLGIARRKVADALRHRYRRKETLASEMPTQEGDVDALLAHLERPPAGPEEEAHRSEARQRIRALVNALKPDQKEALLLHYVEEHSLAEVGIVMGRSAKAVNSLLQRARANLFRAGHDYFLNTNGEEL